MLLKSSSLPVKHTCLFPLLRTWKLWNLDISVHPLILALDFGASFQLKCGFHWALKPNKMQIFIKEGFPPCLQSCSEWCVSHFFFFYKGPLKAPGAPGKTPAPFVQMGTEVAGLPRRLYPEEPSPGRAVIYTCRLVTGWKEGPLFHFDQMLGLKATHCCKLSWIRGPRWNTLPALLPRWRLGRGCE